MADAFCKTHGQILIPLKGEIIMNVNIQLLHPDAVIPTFGSEEAAGADLYALLDAPLTIESGQTVLVKTGVAMAIPTGYVGLIFARSGLATKRGLAPANKVGVIDSDYRGELMVALHNHSNQPQTIEPKERVAQLAIVPFLRPDFQVADTLDDTARGTGGFGSTGTK
jgi:dUTP pyrophosphatase